MAAPPWIFMKIFNPSGMFKIKISSIMSSFAKKIVGNSGTLFKGGTTLELETRLMIFGTDVMAQGFIPNFLEKIHLREGACRFRNMVAEFPFCFFFVG